MTTSRRVVLTSAPFSTSSGVVGLMDYIGGKVWNVVDATGPFPSLLDLINAQPSIDGLILGLQYLGPDECAALVRKGCRFISRDGVGVDNIDHYAARQHGIKVAKTAGVNCLAVAEHTMGLLLAVRRNIVTSSNELASGGWKSVYGTDLDGTKFGLFGLGHVGREVARKAVLGFNMQVMVYDPANTPQINEFCELMPGWIKGCSSRGAFKRASCEDEVLEWGAHLSLNLELQSPGGPSNAGFFNAARIAKCPKGVVLINTARGALVVEADLIEALNSGQISGTGLDVFEEEPLAADSPLRTMPNVICTPHTASKSLPARLNQGEMAVDNLASMFATGRPLKGNLVTLPD